MSSESPDMYDIQVADENDSFEDYDCDVQTKNLNEEVKVMV